MHVRTLILKKKKPLYLSVKVLCAKVLVGDTILRLHLLSFQRINAGVNGPRDFLGGRVGSITYYPQAGAAWLGPLISYFPIPY